MEKTIFGRIKSGDDKAFELLYRQYFVRLCAFANKFVHEPTIAEEIVQEVFLKIWKNRSFLKDINTEKSYLFQAVQNTSFNELAKQKKMDSYQSILKEVYQTKSEFDAHDSLLAKELQQKINKLIDELPDQCRKIYLLSRNEGLKYKQIAQKLDISIKTVETQISRALKKLRLGLQGYLTLLLISLYSNL